MDYSILEKRILDRIVFLSILTIIFYAILQFGSSLIAEETDYFEKYIPTIIIFLAYSSYYLMRSLKVRFSIIKVFIYTMFTGSVIGSFFASNGFNGITSIDFISLLITGIFLFPKLISRAVIISILTLITLSLVYVQSYEPETIQNLIIIDEQITLTVGILTRFVLGINLAVVILQEYNREQNEVKSKNQKIETLNSQLQQSNSDLTNINQSLNDTIKELKATQEQLIQGEKMSSLGVLTTGIAHEINNPLNYIKGGYVGLKDYFDDHGSKDESSTSILLHSINEGVERATKIVKGLNDFSRDNSNYNEDCDVNAIIDNCLVILQNQFKNKIEIIKDYYPDALIINGNVGKLHQVFINILSNSIHAIEENGIIEIETKTKGKQVVVSIRDNGFGMSKEIEKQIMDPFFTTKEPGKGTGLGLSISYSIIKEHQGSIEFESELNKGTKAILKFAVKQS